MKGVRAEAKANAHNAFFTCWSVMSDFATPWSVAQQASLSFTISWSLLKLMSIELVMPCKYLSSVIPFSSCLQSFPASGSFQMSQFFASGGQSIGVSPSASVLPMNIQGWSFLGLTGFYLLAVQETLKNLLQHHRSEVSIFQCSTFFRSNSHFHPWLQEKP